MGISERDYYRDELRKRQGYRERSAMRRPLGPPAEIGRHALTPSRRITEQRPKPSKSRSPAGRYAVVWIILLLAIWLIVSHGHALLRR